MSKYFIITAGPTGSGKTTLVTATLQHLGIDPNSTIQQFLIDDIIQNDAYYKTKVTEILNNLGCNKNNFEITCKPQIDNPSQETFKEFETAYYDTRKEGCNNRGCSNVFDEEILNIKNTPDIVVEITGNKFPKWLLETVIQNFPDYNLIITYSLVNLNNLTSRNRSRASESVKSFLENNENPAPRVVNVSKEAFLEKINEIKNVLHQLYTTCILSFEDKKCGNKTIRLLLFDNNESKHVNIYDSNITKPGLDSFKLLVDNHLSTVDLSIAKKSSNRMTKKSSNRKNSKRTKKKRYTKKKKYN